MTAGEIAGIIGGRLADLVAAAPVTGSVEFDSRKVRAGDLFLALAGAHADGHDYVRDALGRGAVAAIVTRPVDGPSIVVHDAVAAIAALASASIRRLPGVTVIAITGSSGKTSTKDMLAALLARSGQTVAPPGSFNNELGHPYTVLHADRTTRFLVLETSARAIGDIRHLTEIAPPRIGVELNVGSAHLGEFGSREAIAAAKGELVEALPPASDGGVAVLNADDPMVLAMATRTQARVVTFAVQATADVSAADVRLDNLGRAGFTLCAAGASAAVQLRFAGVHHVGNALAAGAVALECGMDLDDVAPALSAAAPASRWRMELTERADGVLLINDAYNANPESTAAALTALASVGRARREMSGRSIAVLGPMAELGSDGPAAHDAIGRLAVRLGLTRVIAVGEAARPIHRAAVSAGSAGTWEGESSWVPDVEAAIVILRNELRPGDVVLVKASRAASLERVALAIAEDSAARDSATGDRGGTGGGAQ